MNRPHRIKKLLTLGLLLVFGILSKGYAASSDPGSGVCSPVQKELTRHTDSTGSNEGTLTRLPEPKGGEEAMHMNSDPQGDELGGPQEFQDLYRNLFKVMDEILNDDSLSESEDD